MVSSLLRLLGQWSKFLVVRVASFAVLALIAVMLSVWFGQYIPREISGFVGEEAMNTIVDTIATSMLAVTTFSLSIMAAAYQTASASMTPRSRLVLRQDSVTQSVLATFVGAFLFSLVVIILRATPLIGESERFLLFCATLAVVVLMLVAILRWIWRLETLGSNDDTLMKLQDHACAAMEAYACAPALGGHVWTEAERDALHGAAHITAREAGYVQQIMENVLQDVAEKEDTLVYVAVSTGDYVVPGQVLLYAKGLSDEAEATLRLAFYIRPTRSFAQDPALGVQVMTEVASRALSPAVNDPQTAVDVANRLSAVFCVSSGVERTGEVCCERVWIIPQSLPEMFAQSYGVIVRDGAEQGEVLSAVRESLGRVVRHGGKRTGELAAKMLEELEPREAARAG